MKTLYNIGPMQLDPEARVLTHGGEAVALGVRAVAVLAALVSRANEYVQKSAILDAAWPGLVVEEANLAVQISAIRRALARVPGGEGWIETLARRGYRFVGPVAAIAGRSAAPVAADRKRSNLPELLTSFVGRERELAELKQLLPTTRLLTLTGTGGIGKTRLAQQAAAEMLDAYRGGVWFVDLAALRDPALVPSALAQVLQVTESAGQSLTTALSNHLRAKETLLILDNCEHVLDACARLIEVLLRETAQVTVLATSREPLHLAAEHSYPVASLPLPDAQADVQNIARSDAVQLFVERARQHRPHFDLQEQRAHAVAEICVRLDGIPLALELAAARVAVLPVEQIVRLLAQRFRLLTSGNRGLPRHQTLHAMIDWSYELLDEAEKALFARLSVFAGGWTLAAAEAVCGGEPIADDEVAYVLIGLIEQSLVIANEDGDRYRLLETIRAYAAEHRTKFDEVELVAKRHAQYFRHHFAQAPDDWLKLTDADWRSTYLPERDNIRAALDWAFGPRGDHALGVTLIAATGPLWSELSLINEGQQRFESAVSSINEQTSNTDRARLWLWQALLWGAAVSSQAVFEKAADAYRQLGDATALVHTLARLSIALTRGGQFGPAAECLKESLLLLERVRLPKVLAHYHRALAFLDVHVGDPAGGKNHFQQAASLYRLAGSERNALATLGDLANLNWELGDLDGALKGFKEAVALMRIASATSRVFGVSLMGLHGVHVERGELAEALVVAREGLPLLQDGGYAWLYLDCAALRAALSGRIYDAARVMGYADSMFQAKSQRRSGNEARARTRLHQLLCKKLAPVEMQRLLAEGADLTDEEACKLLLADDA
jgi:predicted ATPase/DNA-binding winged helix-turn-helix (wHTH) protein